MLLPATESSFFVENTGELIIRVSSVVNNLYLVLDCEFGLDDVEEPQCSLVLVYSDANRLSIMMRRVDLQGIDEHVVIPVAELELADFCERNAFHLAVADHPLL